MKSSQHNEAVKIRPHHGLCAEFFRGKGYSGEFTENMALVLERLERENPEVLPASEGDLICRRCPNNEDGCCNAADKVLRYDKKVMELCGLAEGTVIFWEEYRRLLREKIIGAGRLKEVCGDCQWAEICGQNVVHR